MRFSTKLKVIFGIIILFCIAGFVAITEGFYPALSVNGGFVSARNFSEKYATAIFYYANLEKTYGKASGVKSLQPDEIRASILESLIEEQLIHAATVQKIGGALQNLIQNKISKYDNDTTLARSSAELYGVQFADFKRIILIPEAEKEILAGRLFLEGKKIEDWLVTAKHSAGVTIFSPRFHWDGEHVTVN